MTLMDLTVCSGSQPNQLDEAALIAILKVSRFWLIEESIAWVISRLEELDLSPSRRLQLARMYGIPQWIAPATRQLIHTPLGNITASDAECLGLQVYTIIAKARERLEIEHRSIGVVAPGLSLMPSVECSLAKHSICKDVWAQLWWNKVAYRVLHPTNPLDLSALFDYVTGLPDPQGLHPQCKAMFLEQIVETGTLGVKDLVIEAAVVAIQAYFNLL